MEKRDNNLHHLEEVAMHSAPSEPPFPRQNSSLLHTYTFNSFQIWRTVCPQCRTITTCFTECWSFREAIGWALIWLHFTEISLGHSSVPNEQFPNFLKPWNGKQRNFKGLETILVCMSPDVSQIGALFFKHLTYWGWTDSFNSFSFLLTRPVFLFWNKGGGKNLIFCIFNVLIFRLAKLMELATLQPKRQMPVKQHHARKKRKIKDLLNVPMSAPHRYWYALNSMCWDIISVSLCILCYYLGRMKRFVVQKPPLMHQRHRNKNIEDCPKVLSRHYSLLSEEPVCWKYTTHVVWHDISLPFKIFFSSMLSA